MRDHIQHASKSKYIVLTYDLILPLIIIFGIIGGIAVSLKSDLFAVKIIRCRVDYQDCPVGPVMAELEKYIGHNLLTVQTDELEQRLTAGDFTIREAVITKKLPDTLSVELQSVYPVAALRVEGVESEWIVFDSGYRVIGKRTSDPNVPTVLVKTAPTVHAGYRIDDPALVKALDYTLLIASEINSVTAVALEGDTLTLVLASGKTALLTTVKDSMAQIRTLQAILQANTMNSEVRTIDVRFSKPVLRSN